MEQPKKQSGSSSGELSRSIIAPEEDPRKYVRDIVDSIFSDRFMAFLALQA